MNPSKIAMKTGIAIIVNILTEKIKLNALIVKRTTHGYVTCAPL